MERVNTWNWAPGGKWIVAYELWGDEERLKADPIRSFQLYVRFSPRLKHNPSSMTAPEARRLEQGVPVGTVAPFRELPKGLTGVCPFGTI